MRKWIVLVWLAVASAAPGQWANDNAADLLGEAYVRTLYPGMRLANSFGLAGPTGLPTGDTWTTNGLTTGFITLAGVKRSTWPAGGAYAEAMNQGVATTNSPAWPEVIIGGISATQRLSQASIAYNWGNHASVGYLLNFSSMTASHLTAAGGVTTNNPAYLEALSKSGTAVQANYTGDVAIVGQLSATKYPVNRSPHFLASSTNHIIDISNGDLQAITNIVAGSTTIRFPAGTASFDQALMLTVPPVGTNSVTLASTSPEGATITVTFGDSLTALSTGTYSRCWWSSSYGATNATVIVWKGSL